ncbi:hypothetical protein BGZ81_002755 [Podila clonocystis]|nr:hypothetical protein BGZ81_002755 [Podila clonocystis]
MSLQVNFTTHGRELKAAYDAILRPADPKSGDNWAMFGYDKGSNDLKVLGQGAGGLEELEDEFVDGKIQYAFVRIIDPNSQLNKFILIAWCGDGVPESKKGLFNSHLADVSQFLKGYHLQINARSEFDVTPAQIMKRVNEGSGSKYSIHKETYEQERIRPLQSAYKKTEIPDIAALQRNPTKPESAPKYNVGSKPVVSTPPAKPAEPSWKSSSSPSVPSPPTSSSSSAASKIQSWNKISQGSSYTSSGHSFNKVAPPPSLANYGITTSSASTPNDPSMNKAQQIRLEREAREKEERERIAKEIRDRETRERQIDDQSGAQKQAEERRLQEQREREQEQQRQEQRSQDRAREERAAREREERERSEAEDAARAAREAAKAREDAQARDRATQAEDQQRQKEQEQRQREREEREEADRIAKQKRDEEAHRRKQQEEEEEEERRQQAEDERRQQEAADEKRRLEEDEQERRLQQEVDAATNKTLEFGADALIASSAHPEIASGSVSAVVLYSYEKAEENEMSLFEGEIITNVTELDVGWWSGESEDGTRSGLFPANYVEIIEHVHHEPAAAAPVFHEEEHHVQETHPAATSHVDEVLSSKPTAVALYDYNAGEPNEISFSEGEIIVEIDFVTEDWWSGHSQDGTRSGLFPSNYVELHQ